MKEYFGADYQPIRRRHIKCLSQSIEKSVRNKPSIQDFDAMKTQQAFNIDIQWSEPSYSLTRNNKRNIKTGYNLYRKADFHSKTTTHECHTNENKSWVAWTSTAKNPLKTSEKGTLTNKSYFKSESTSQSYIISQINKIEKWLDSEEVNLNLEYTPKVVGNNTKALGLSKPDYLNLSSTLDTQQSSINTHKLSILTQCLNRLKDVISTHCDIDLKIIDRVNTSILGIFENTHKSIESKVHQYETRISILQKVNKKLEIQNANAMK